VFLAILAPLRGGEPIKIASATHLSICPSVNMKSTRSAERNELSWNVVPRNLNKFVDVLQFLSALFNDAVSVETIWRLMIGSLMNSELEGRGRGLFSVLSLHMPWGTEKYLSLIYWCSSRGSRRIPPKCKSRELTEDQSVRPNFY
jgi:hypothetical protein